MHQLTVIDFFCGAGGFSEGFKQMGYDIIYGYDHWKPAVETFNHNFNLQCNPKNILDFENSINEINAIPNTDIILGSPPCVSFSSSNKSGKADKSLGVKLTETFLKIVAVKKHQPNSTLKAWFMENVVNSKRYLQTAYTFKDLGLTDWANMHKISPNKIAIDLFENTTVINSADYGSIQARKRVVSGEIIKKKKLIIPKNTHSNPKIKGSLPLYKTIHAIQQNFPNPFQKETTGEVKDINYDLKTPQNKITDHFYDTGVYEVEWRFSKFWKQNHPYMGRMSFPENRDKPSRTITATKIANSRESIIYKSEVIRKGDGEYRLPTVREAAMIMGFPITYQFIGSENTKWRLVGNAVCCAVSRALADTVLQFLRIDRPKKLIVNKTPELEGVLNLNTYILKEFNNPPVKNKGARFRRHPIKDGNLTVTLSNYDIEKSSNTKNKWFTSIQYGTGEGFPVQKVKDEYYKELEPLIESFKGGKRFLEIINNGFSKKIGNKIQLQDMYEKQTAFENFKEPTQLVDEIASIIEKVGCTNSNYEQNKLVVFEKKSNVPIKQVFALYAINKISSIANNS
ncbi:DNA (cytosine-5)-methyltransferase 1 [Flavobacteriaceae bacterium MAR_2010_105]|nr:DNA (cytosine-5)-methyltransferase 1 [Flavobacteriaceae bacterium MAR_2010_105]